MKRGVIGILLICLLVTSLVSASCTSSTATTSTITTSTNTATTTTSTITTSTNTATSTATTNTATSTATTITTTSAAGNWWDSLGAPQYGGTITIRLNKDIANFDPYYPSTSTNIMSLWMERVLLYDWTLDPAIFDYHIGSAPSDYLKPFLAQSFEFTDPGTIVFHLRQGIHWQNIPPVNGRELTANDVAYHYQREFGLVSGMAPSPYISGWGDLISATATDKYTVVFKWKTPNPENMLEIMGAVDSSTFIECPDAVQQWGNLLDWHHAIGTGPFILTDFVPGSSATLVKNPAYWGYDERYPQNQLPYADGIKVLIIPDDSTALSALRTGKIDVIEGNSTQTAQQMQKTNPEILQLTVPLAQANTVDPKWGVTPYSDIRVREAMQMAIDLPTIAKSYYGGTSYPYPTSITSVYLKGWGLPYLQWPQDLKDQYTYDPTTAKQLLAAAGYPNGFNTDVVADQAADLDLLQIVKSYFAAVGINMDIRLMDSASWVTYVMTGHKQDALVYRSSGTLGQTFAPFRQVQRFLPNYSANWCQVNDPGFNVFYPEAMAATSIDEAKKVVAACNEYIARQHYVISLIQPMTYSLYQPWLKGYNGQFGVFTTTVTGNQGFYISRFWIDQKLKKSMGH